MTDPLQPEELESRFLLDEFTPVYLETVARGELAKKVEAALEELRECRACPRDCGIDRLRGETKVCNTGRHALVSSWGPHHGEEDGLRGWSGSGTIFFNLCNLRCVFCQNWDISQQHGGREMNGAEIAALMLDLQSRGCHNINFVTPEHVAPQVIEAIGIAVPAGLRIPIVYNTSAYDALSTLALLDGLVDIYMPDFKFWSEETARKLAKAKDYPHHAREAICEMHRQVGPLKFGRDGLARRGVLIRHLVMPGQIEESAAIFDWLASEISRDTFVNIMGQYHPDYEVGKIASDGATKYPEIDRRLTPAEMKAAIMSARRAGLWRFDARHPLWS